MKAKLFSLIILFFSINTFATSDDSCAGLADSAIKSVSTVNNGLAVASPEIMEMKLSRGGSTPAGNATYCSELQSVKYCASVKVVGGACQVFNLDVSNPLF